MGKVLWRVKMSLDGFIAGPGDAIGWIFGHDESSPLAEEIVEETGAVLAGTRWYYLAMSRFCGAKGMHGGLPFDEAAMRDLAVRDHYRAANVWLPCESA